MIKNYLQEQIEIFSSKALKRLQEKSQIVANFEDKNIHISNRLTHSLEVGTVAKMIVNRLPVNLNIDKEQVFNICLLHDIGHPSLGHFLEDKLNEILNTTNKYSFEGNANNFVVIEKEGIKVTDKTLVGLIKYPREINKLRKKGIYSYHFDSLIRKALNEYVIQKESLQNEGYGWKNSNLDQVKSILRKKIIINNDLENINGNFRILESIIMEYADDITYLTHDLKDFLTRRSELSGKKIKLDDIVDLNKYVTNDPEILFLEEYLFKYDDSNSNDISNMFKTIMINNIRFDTQNGILYTHSQKIEDFKQLLRKLLFEEFIKPETIKIDERVKDLNIFEKYFKNIEDKEYVKKIVFSGTYTKLINETKNIEKKYRYMANYIAEKTDSWLF